LVDFTKQKGKRGVSQRLIRDTQKKKSEREVPIDRYSSEKREREEQRRHSFSFARRVAILVGRET
jgi:hypothetical protein